MSLADILNTVLDETGFDKPASYFGNTEQAAVRARTLANASAQDLVNLPHRVLVKEASISITTDTLYNIPADLHEWIRGTMYENGDTWAVDFPTTDQGFASLKSSTVNSSVLDNVRLIGGQLEIFNPVDGEQLDFTYRSNHPITNAAGDTTKAKYTADDDLWVLDTRLHELDIIWRWKKLHGMDYQDDLAIFKRYEQDYLGRQNAAQSISFNDCPEAYWPRPQYDPWVD